MKNSEKYIIGIDAGASKTEVLIVIPACLTASKAKAGIQRNYLNKKNISVKRYPPINYNLLGEKKTIQNLLVIIRQEIKKIKSNNISIVIGISGARNKKDRDEIKKHLIKKFKIKNISVLTDTEIALASIFDKNEKNCGILIAGTGSILYYRDSNGKINRFGGWGRHIGDEGSGYWIGREAINKLTKFFDGIRLETNLDKVIRKHLSMDGLNLIRKIYHENFDLSKIAGYVFMSAEKGDKLSNEIIKEAAEHLAKHFDILKKTKLNRRWRIGLLGSLFTNEKLLERYLRNIVRKKYPNIELVKTIGKPVLGAVKIGMEKELRIKN